ncbi:hypothetical protein [Reinekea sp. G2M2-21]|uniref:hypothetical protein n=1 Tax=Reinekea sp. G2M2-21 TaxID=2788942 RepID=UPI0018AC8D70|nr:hypothetical protein [Reinekea sp. G2M2-21]
MIELLNGTQPAASADADQTALTIYSVAKALNLEGIEAERVMAKRFSSNVNRNTRKEEPEQVDTVKGMTETESA